MAGPIVCKDPTCKFTFSGVVVDISDHIKTVEPSTEVEIVDLHTRKQQLVLTLRVAAWLHRNPKIVAF